MAPANIIGLPLRVLVLVRDQPRALVTGSRDPTKRSYTARADWLRTVHYPGAMTWPTPYMPAEQA